MSFSIPGDVTIRAGRWATPAIVLRQRLHNARSSADARMQRPADAWGEALRGRYCQKATTWSSDSRQAEE